MHKENRTILTGDRPTGPLHLGHFVGSLANRVKSQDSYDQFVMVADVQALTDHYDSPETIQKHSLEIVYDYLSVGIDPKKTVIFIQSLVPAIAELTIFYLNLVTWNRLKHNPTVKAEITQKKMGENVPAGFMIYPISQTADITAFKARYVPVGDDQVPILEQCQEIVRKFNRLYKTEVLVEPLHMPGVIGRLPGTDGKAKMSKSLGNAIFLSDEPNVVEKKVKGMFTDPNHLKVEDPGKVEGNPVFTYLDAFDPDKKELEKLKEHYRRGGLGDSIVKKRLIEVLNAFLNPIRQKRKELAKDPSFVKKILKEGTEKANLKANATLKEVKHAMGIDYCSLSSL